MHGMYVEFSKFNIVLVTLLCTVLNPFFCNKTMCHATLKWHLLHILLI